MRIHTLDFGINSEELVKLKSLHGKKVRITMEVELDSSGQIPDNFVSDDNFVDIRDYPSVLEVESLDKKIKVSI